MDKRRLGLENRIYRQTKGVSENNRHCGFQPAFLDKETGRIEIARTKNGEPATMHIIGWLPEEWATARADDGTILSLKEDIVAGFTRDGVFYTRAELAES